MPNHVRTLTWLALTAAASTALGAAGCGAEDADPGPRFAAPFAGASGAGSSATAGGGGATTGAGGSSPASGGAGAGGSASGAGGAGSGGGPAAPSVGRVGAELCPPGPFGSPLPADVNQAIVHLASAGGSGSFNWEGPVWTGDALLFSEIAGDDASQINRYRPGGSVERGVFAGSGSNGLALDASLDLLLAAHDVGAISRLELPGGALTRGTQTYGGLRFNSPNDLVLRADGNLYFTDPDFQSPSGRIQGDTRVYRIAPAGQVSVVDDGIDQPNGITLSPDGNTLYVAGGNVLRAYTLDASGAPSPLRTFPQSLQVPDGMAMDCAGNVYAVENSARRVRVFSPDGALLGTLGPQGFDDQGLTNLAFGGPDRRTLFISAFTQGSQGGLYSVELQVPGLPY